MHLLYPLLLTFVYHVLWAPEHVLVCQLGVSAERRLLYSDTFYIACGAIGVSRVASRRRTRARVCTRTKTIYRESSL